MKRSRSDSSTAKHYANLAGVEVGDGFPVRILGAINVSPESFYGGSVARGRRALQRLAQRMVAEGADVLDVGAMSTAPYMRGTIDEAEERRRMTVAVRAVRAAVDVPISADTQRSAVAAAALDAGASIINDVSGLRHDAAMGAVAHAAAGVVLMAAEHGPSRQPPLAMIAALLRACLGRAGSARIPLTRIVLDPGIGFFRQAAVPWHELDCHVLDKLAQLRRLRRPLLVGVSRKSFIGKLTGQTHPDARLFGSLAATAIAVYNGAAIIRTHDVAPTVEAVRIAEAIRAR
ncbi:MAG TPA: dihydropteroate synthase [Candidatus Acidoferrales bacterium]|nr:dihydropteroate synthase [Candidatus Acidoferrales bacterium]